jgi:hypothetical protein
MGGCKSTKERVTSATGAGIEAREHFQDRLTKGQSLFYRLQELSESSDEARALTKRLLKTLRVETFEEAAEELTLYHEEEVSQACGSTLLEGLRSYVALLVDKRRPFAKYLPAFYRQPKNYDRILSPVRGTRFISSDDLNLSGGLVLRLRGGLLRPPTASPVQHQLSRHVHATTGGLIDTQIGAEAELVSAGVFLVPELRAVVIIKGDGIVSFESPKNSFSQPSVLAVSGEEYRMLGAAYHREGALTFIYASTQGQVHSVIFPLENSGRVPELPASVLELAARHIKSLKCFQVINMSPMLNGIQIGSDSLRQVYRREEVSRCLAEGSRSLQRFMDGGGQDSLYLFYDKTDVEGLHVILSFINQLDLTNACTPHQLKMVEIAEVLRIHNDQAFAIALVELRELLAREQFSTNEVIALYSESFSQFENRDRVNSASTTDDSDEEEGL